MKYLIDITLIFSVGLVPGMLLLNT